MPWLRIGDTATTHPGVFRLLEACDGSIALRNEAWGFLTFIASVSAAHTQDYLVSDGLAQMTAPGRHAELLARLKRAGLVSECEVDGRHMWKITPIDDLLHMRLKAEVEIDRNRKRDSRRPDLMVPVRVRDGDMCRWCGKSVKFADHKSNRGGTIDSLTSHEDSTVDTLVVACRGCNSARKEGKEKKLLPVPSRKDVYYEPSTIDWINRSDWAREHGVHITSSQTELDLGVQDKPRTPHTSDDQVIDGPTKGNGGPASASSGKIAAPHDQPPATPSSAPAASFGDDLDDAPDWVTNPVPTVRVTNSQAAAVPDGGRAAPADSTPDHPDHQAAAGADQRRAAPEAGPGGSARRRPGVDQAAQAAAGADQRRAAPTAGHTHGHTHRGPTTSNNPKDNGKIKPDSDPAGSMDRRVTDPACPGRDGTGREGQGRDGPGRSWPGLPRSGRSRRRRRGRRSGKGRAG